MNKYRFAIAAAMALLSLACTQEANPVDNTPEEDVQDGFKVLSIEASQVDTKTAYDGEVTFSWSAGDKISVLCNDGSSNFWQTFTVTTPSSSSTFTATVANGVNIGAIDGKKVALYPADDSHVYNSSSDIRFHIPAERDFRSANGGHKESAIPMFAWGDENDCFAFANLTGAVKFSFSKIPSTVTQVKMEFTNTCHLQLNGTYALSLSSNAANVHWSAASTEVESESSVSYYADVENGKASFYLPYAAGTIWAYNHLKLTDANNPSATPMVNMTKVGQISVVNNRIVVLPTISAKTGSVDTGYTSAYGLNWNTVDAAENNNPSYPAIKSLKAQADFDYLYLLLEVNPTKIETSHKYAHRFYLYAGDWSTTFGNESWAIHNSAASYYNWETDYSDFSTDTSDPDSWIYEIRLSRTHSTTSSALGSASSVNIGVKMDNRVCDNNGSGEVWGYANGASSTTTIGKIPSSGLYTVTLPSTGEPVASVNIDETFTESSDDIKNPERGLYKFVEYKYHKHNSSEYTNPNYSLTDSYDENNTLTMTLFYLFDFVDGDAITTDGLNYIRSVLTNVRNSGKKAIVRFGYSDVHEEDKTKDPQNIHQEPTLSQILDHIEQIKPILTDFEDIIYVAQAGFIGTYGEWYYTTHFSNFSYSDGKWTETRDWTYNSSTDKVTGFEDREDVLDAILDAFPASRQIQVRTPAYKQFYLSPNSVSSWTQLNGFGTDAVHRLSFHNDAFLYGGSDLGTFHYAYERAMWQQQAEYLICGGEAPYSSTSITEMEGYNYNNIPAGVYNNHYSFLHHDIGWHEYPNDSSHGSTLMRWWHEQGWMPAIKKMLGYRLYLTDITVTGSSASSGSTLDVSFTIKNSGAARVINARPMKFVLLHNGAPTILKDSDLDIRLVPAGTVSGTTVTPGTHTYTFQVTLTQDIVTGDQLAIWLPDNAAGLQSRPEYSIRLANNEITWSNGYNVFCTFQ